MTLQEQMIAANVRNWLADLAIGAKAMNTTILCAPCEEYEAFKYETSTYEDVIRDDVITVFIHNVKAVAKAADLELHYRTFKEGDYYFKSFTGEYFVLFNDVKFSDMTMRREVEDERK